MNTIDDKVEIRIEAVDNGWIMGDELKLTMQANDSLFDIARAIHKLKGISTHRMTFVIHPKRIIPIEKWNDCICSFGICSGSKINLKPTFSGCWQWERQQYYIDQTLIKIIELIRGKRVLRDEELTGDINDISLSFTLEKIQQAISFPPPMKSENMLLFIRQYPEIFHVEIDTKLNEVNVTLNKNNELPVWL